MENVINFDLLKEYDTTLKDVLQVWTKQKAYSLGDKVKYKGHLLECTTAGTSGTTTLNFTGLDIGDTITDGTVVWELVEPPSGKGIDFYTVGESYNVGDIVIYSGNIYQCITAHTATSTFDTTKWEEVSKSGIPYYSQDTYYKVDDQVVYNNKIYKCITAHTSTSTFDDSKWEELSGAGIAVWQPNTAYEVQDIVIYNYVIYMCREAHTSATCFEYNKWIIIGGGNGDFGDYVGHITWQMSLQSNYLKLDGTPLANASNDYNELLKFAQDNSLITADTTDKSLFKYDSNNDVLTLPDYIGLCLQGGNTVEEKEAGLPNIKGTFGSAAPRTMYSGNNPTSALSIIENGSTYAYGGSAGPMITTFDASLSNPIYSDSVNTVQPPAITLIPQIRYKYSGNTYSTTEQRIGTWIDGKPLYQITLIETMPVVSSEGVRTSKLISINSLNAEMFIEVGGCIDTKLDATTEVFDNFGAVNNFSTSSYTYITAYNENGEMKLQIVTTRRSDSSQNCYITLKYTKTTD